MPNSAHEYFKATIPEPYQILGVRLKPLTLHHCILMQWAGVSFVKTDDAVADYSDLLLGVLICSKNWNEGEFENHLFSRREFVWWNPATWFKQSPILEDASNWGKRAGLFDLKEKVELFKKYVDTQSEEPAYWDGENASDSQSGAHWIQCVLLTLTANLGYARQEALHSPLPQILADYFRYAEMNGVVKLMTPEEIRFLKGAA